MSITSFWFQNIYNFSCFHQYIILSGPSLYIAKSKAKISIEWIKNILDFQSPQNSKCARSWIRTPSTPPLTPFYHTSKYFIVVLAIKKKFQNFLKKILRNFFSINGLIIFAFMLFCRGKYLRVKMNYI